MRFHSGAFLAVALIVLAQASGSQEEDGRSLMSPGLHKLAGVEVSQHIQYARIFLDGRLVGGPSKEPRPSSDPAGRQPVLIAQCTRNAAGKMRFELLMNFGSVRDFSYHPPWRSTGPEDLFAPRTQKVAMTFNFIGYTKVKPVKRQWEMQFDPYGEMRYNPPSGGFKQHGRDRVLHAIPEGAAYFADQPWVTNSRVRNHSLAEGDS